MSIDMQNTRIVRAIAYMGRLPVVCPRCGVEWEVEGYDFIEGFARATDGRHWLYCGKCLEQIGRES